MFIVIVVDSIFVTVQGRAPAFFFEKKATSLSKKAIDKVVQLVRADC